MGDMLLCHGDVVNGRRRLMQAATLFGQEHDWAAQTEALGRLRDVPWAADSSAAHEHLVPAGPPIRGYGDGPRPAGDRIAATVPPAGRQAPRQPSPPVRPR
jgi:hypothetical protein